MLDLPGGAPQIGETLEHAVAREVLEETGYRVNPTEIAFVAERREDRWSTSVLEICFYADIISEVREKPVAHDGVFAAEWLPLDHADVRQYMPHADLFSVRKRGRVHWSRLARDGFVNSDGSPEIGLTQHALATGPATECRATRLMAPAS